MKISKFWLERQIACLLAVLLAAPFCGAEALPDAGQSAGANTAPAQSQTNTATQNKTPAGNTQSSSADSSANPPAAPASSTDQSQTPTAPQPVTNAPQTAAPPVGTAVAPYVKPEGNPASMPAGAAIAPAKQRRIRSLAIRLGLLAGAGIAIGTVAAASMGSSSRPH